jgi:hypothetical protein
MGDDHPHQHHRDAKRRRIRVPRSDEDAEDADAEDRVGFDSLCAEGPDSEAIARLRTLRKTFNDAELYIEQQKQDQSPSAPMHVAALQSQRAKLLSTIISFTNKILRDAIIRNDIELGIASVSVGFSSYRDMSEIICDNMLVISVDFLSRVIVSNAIRLAPSGAEGTPGPHAAPMVRAAEAGRGDVLRILSCDATGLSVRDAMLDGRTALHAAAAENRAHTSSIILSLGGSMFAKDSCGRTPLCLAVDSGKVDALKAMLDFESSGLDGDSHRSHFAGKVFSRLVTRAAISSNCAALRDLIGRGAVPEVGCEFELVRQGRVDSLAVMLESGSVVPDASIDSDGRTNLLRAAILATCNREAMVRVILSRGATVSASDLDACEDPSVRAMLVEKCDMGVHRS